MQSKWKWSPLRGVVGAMALLVTAGVTNAAAADNDADGTDDLVDNCPGLSNRAQGDCDGNGVGDACEAAAANQDTDGDGRCNGIDNCPSVANTAQADCNGNGVGDYCEAAVANRDADSDGVCNGVDACPREAGACGMRAITVPWVPSNPTMPHPIWSTQNTTLKGIARYGGNQYMWDYGDGSPPMAWTAITNPYNLGAKHVYTGAVGQLFIATLSVRNSANPAVVSTATYRVRIEGAASVGANPPPADIPGMDLRVDVAIDEGLWYLHTTATRTTYADGAPGYAEPYGYWSNNYSTCVATDAFQLNGSKINGDYATNPYVETVQRGLTFVLASSAATQALSLQPAGHPDVNGNGIGIRIGANDTYINGICGVTVASSGAPNVPVPVGAANIRGRFLRDIAQDMVDYFAWGQADSGTYRGGWHYSANSNTADGSTNQWPPLVMGAAEANMGSTVPAFVRSEMAFFLNYSRHTALDNNNGGWGYQGPNDAYVNHAKTAAGISLHHFMGTDENSAVYKAAQGFLYRNWSSNNYGGGGAWNVGLGNSYAMYGVMKAMRLPEPDTTRIHEFNYNTGVQTANSVDWYYSPANSGREGLAVNLVRRQNANGSWSDVVGNNAQSGAFATGWDILILSKGVTTIPPSATICACAGQEYDQNQDVTVDGSCSTHPEQTRSIVSYEWDFNYTGGTFDSEATGAHATKVGGYAMYGTYPVALRVTDDNPDALGGPQTNIVTCNVVIKPPPHCPHVDAGGPYAGFLGTPLTFDGSGTFDPDNDPLTYAWDLDNDGLFGAADNDVFGAPSDGVGVQPDFTYHATRFAPVAVRVTDHPSQNAFPYEAPECTVTAYSTVEIGNHAPVSNPGGPYTAVTNSTIQLDGSLSSDVDPGDVLTYAWDLNNDGVFNDANVVNPNFTVGAVGGVQYSVCLKVTDSAGATHTRCTTVVSVANRAPTCDAGPGYGASTCVAGNIPLVLSGSGTDADGDALTFTWSTNCGGGSTFDDTHLAGATLNLAPVCSKACTVTLVVGDGKTTTTCSAAVNVADTTAPAFSQTPAPTTAECGADTADALADWLISVSAADACGQVDTQTATNFAGGACGGDTGVTTAVFTATDACSNSAEVGSTFTVVDTTAPTVDVPADETFESDGAGNAADVAAWLAAATGADDCSAASLVNDFTGLSDGCGATGAATVAFTATDACGLETTRSATVTVRDTTDPAFAGAGPSAHAVECGADQGAADLAAWLGSFSATDANGATVSNDFSALTADCGGTGHANVTFTAADACGNDTSAQAAFAVIDTAGPIYYLAPSDREIECDADTNAGALAEWLASAAAQDACGSANTAVSNDFVALSDLCGQTGVADVNFVAADACGNESTVGAQVAIVDRTAPTFAAGAAQDRSVECDGQGNQAELNAWLASVDASDRCGSASVAHAFPGLSDACGATGTGVATWTATDECGNASDSIQATFTVVDTRAPVFTVIPQDLAVESDGDGNTAQLQQWLANVAAADTCGDVTITNDFTALSDGPGHTGSVLVTWTATDACGQNKATTSARFIIQDTTPPVVSCPGDTIELSADDCTAGITLNGTAEDTDGGQITLSHTYQFSAVGTQTFTYTFRDPSGNETPCTQTVNAVDETAPVVTCAADEILNLSAATCEASKSYTSTARDNCGGAMNQAHTFNFTAPGSDTFTYTFTDAAGLSASCTQTVQAADVTAPTFAAGPVTQLWSPNHQYVAVKLAQCGTFRDACGGAVDPAAGAGRVTRISSDELEQSKGSGNFRDDMVIQNQSTVGLRSEREGGGNGRVYRIHFTLTDAAGNTSSAQTCRVDVPHDQSGSAAIEGAPVYWEP